MDVNGEKLFLQIVLLQHLPAGAKLTNHLTSWLMYRCISPVGGSEVLVVKTGLPSTVLYLFCAFRWNLWFNQCSLTSHGHLVFSFLYCFSFFSPQLFLLLIFVNICWNLSSILDSVSVCSVHVCDFMYTSLLYIMSIHTDEACFIIFHVFILQTKTLISFSYLRIQGSKALPP